MKMVLACSVERERRRGAEKCSICLLNMKRRKGKRRGVKEETTSKHDAYCTAL